jgi:hypothetical protein
VLPPKIVRIRTARNSPSSRRIFLTVPRLTATVPAPALFASPFEEARMEPNDEELKR